LDTSALVALADAKDTNHATAEKFLKSLARSKRGLATSTYVADELLTLVRMRVSHAAAVKTGEGILNSKWIRLIEVDEDIRDLAWNLFVRYSDQRFSFSDCTSFAIMQRMAISEAFTYDRKDFLAAGFVALPDDARR
jgi:predicted nucleic acid-binding protein